MTGEGQADQKCRAPNHVDIPANSFRTTFPTLRLLCSGVFSAAVVFCQTPSSLTLDSSPNPASYGQAVTLLATVTTGATGKVTFYDGTTVLGIGTISGTQAALTTAMLA